MSASHLKASLDADGDSTMHSSSPSSSSAADDAVDDETLGMSMTAADTDAAGLDGLDSRRASASAPGAGHPTSPPRDGFNANGKRLHPTAVGGGAAGGPQGEAKVHEASGYTWVKDEAAPGHKWQNKRAQDEYQKTMDTVVEWEAAVGLRYGDPVTVELVED